MPGLIIQLLAYTILIIVMIIGLQKVSLYIQSKNSIINKDKSIKVLERNILSKDKELLIVEVYGRKYFLSATMNNISILKELGSEND